MSASDEVESLKQQLAFAESIHKVTVQQRDTAWAALNDRREQMDHLKAALNERQRELLTWERRYKDLIAEYSNAVALRPPPPIIINAPPQDRWSPIETAPKDGSIVLLAYKNALGRWRRVRAYWADAEEVGEWEDNGNECEPGWYERSEAHENATETVYPVECAPTHWTPLPPAPDESAALAAGRAVERAHGIVGGDARSAFDTLPDDYETGDY